MIARRTSGPSGSLQRCPLRGGSEQHTAPTRRRLLHLSRGLPPWSRVSHVRAMAESTPVSDDSPGSARGTAPVSCSGAVERHAAQQQPGHPAEHALCWVICGVSGSGKRSASPFLEAAAAHSVLMLTPHWLQHCWQASGAEAGLPLLRRGRLPPPSKHRYMHLNHGAARLHSTLVTTA